VEFQKSIDRTRDLSPRVVQGRDFAANACNCEICAKKGLEKFPRRHLSTGKSALTPSGDKKQDMLSPKKKSLI
jgi:hypothetical protein